MKRYLITSEYFYYDEYSIENVCICETKKLAEYYANIYRTQLDEFKNTLGYDILLSKKDYHSFINTISEQNIIDNDSYNINVFIPKNKFNEYKHSIKDCYYKKTNYLDFMTQHFNKDTIMKKICVHENTSICITEIEYFK